MSTFPIAAELPSADGSHTYVGRARTQLRYGLILILASLVGLTQAHPFLLWYHGGPLPEPRAFLVLSCLLLFPLGLVGLTNAIRGLPRLTLGPQGVTLQNAFGTTWANWDSVGPFVIKTTVSGRSRREVKAAMARITGPNTSSKPSKLITISNHYDASIEEIAADLNAVRAASVGIPHAPGSAAAYAVETPVGLSGFAVPWLTLALLGLLIIVFILENSFPVTPAVKGAPSLQTLAAMGALDHAAILSRGEWYRLFTAPLLHASFAHIFGNALALLLGGWLLERLVGRLWFFAFFAVGALGGSLGSLVLEPANIISVGASGALMGMFAGLFVGSFRIGSGNSARTRLQISSLRILIPSLIPAFSHSTGIHIDYGAHLGGALAGSALALTLLQLWPETSSIPEARPAATIIVAVSLLLFTASVALAIDKYPQYKVALASPPQRLAIPNTTVDGRASYLRDNHPTGNKPYSALGTCATLFPKGQGAVPGINCAK